MFHALRKYIPHLHYACTALLAIAAIPAIHRLHLPMHLNWRGMVVFYWVGLGSRSLLYALVFCLLALPLAQTLAPFWVRYRKEKLRTVFALLFLAVLSYLLPFTIAALLTTDALLIVELAERTRIEGRLFRKKVISVFASAVYMFIGISLVMIYNDIIVASRFPLSYDGVLNQVDMWVLGGRSVSAISHAMSTVLPAKFLSFLDIAYFQMFFIQGAAFLISAYHSSRRGLQFAGTCLSAYYLALLIFYIWPTYGPYVYCINHTSQYPSYLEAYAFQKTGLASLQAVSQHRIRYLASGYYIAFPCLHVALPLIAMWFLRRWRRVFWLLAIYTVLIAFTIVILEWHYALDIPGGIAVGALAIALVGRERL